MNGTVLYKFCADVLLRIYSLTQSTAGNDIWCQVGDCLKFLQQAVAVIKVAADECVYECLRGQ